MGVESETAPCLVVLGEGARCALPAEGNGYCVTHSWLAERDLEIFKVVAEHYRQDLRLFWQRCNLYLIVHAALVSVYATIESASLAPMLGVFGLVLSVFWYLVARGSFLWIRRWRAELTRLDRIVDRFQAFAQVEERGNAYPWLSPSWVTQWLPIAFGLGWMGLMALSLS